MNEAVIVAALRTAQGKFDGTLKSFSAPQLGGIVIKEVVKQTKIQSIQEVQIVYSTISKLNINIQLFYVCTMI